ncbi:MAG: hypothetical protein K2O14_10515 [Oscillospiraceae bacterium]|nr:hypothetical protein [Oscillospiraceae bacterium]
MRELIIVEGLPCSGKSSAARYIADKFDMKCFDEDSGKHPADYEFHAFVQASELDKFSHSERNRIVKKSERKYGGVVVPLAEFQGELFNRLLQYKIYDFLPWETEKTVMLGKWREFAENKKPDEGYVFNCVLLQNPMCETMMRFDLPLTESEEYISEICGIIKDMNPLVVYLENNDIGDSVNMAVDERGNDWLDAVIDYHCGGAYGKSKQLSGFDGYISALEERQRRELEILSRVNIDKVVLVDPQRDWKTAYRVLDKRLSEMM